MESSKETGCRGPENPVLCINDCDFFGSAAMMNMCSKCQKDMILLKQEHAKLAAASSKDVIRRSSSSDESELVPAVNRRKQKGTTCFRESMSQIRIVLFSFVVKEPAKRNSKNRTARTMETKPIQSVTKDITRACLIEKVLPAIRVKWPTSDSNNPIFLQQDNKRPHIGNNDLEFIEAARQDGFDIRLCFQPWNSPDLNVLDLGFYRAIQSLQYEKAPKNVDELVEAVERSFDEMKPKQLNHVFPTLQSCMIEVMKDSGGNNYKCLI
ncbi:hypothetical protein P3S68_028997 [Capsicum galapagoense]